MANSGLHCCYIGVDDTECDNDATHVIRGPNGFEDYTHACDEHVAEMTSFDEKAFALKESHETMEDSAPEEEKPKHKGKHLHVCVRCKRPYKHANDGRCNAQRNKGRTCDRCWQVYLDGATHPNFGKDPD